MDGSHLRCEGREKEGSGVCGSGVVLGLGLVEGGVDAVLGKKRVVCAVLCDAAMVEDHNAVTEFAAAHAVGDVDGGFAGNHLAELFVDFSFGDWIEGSGRLAEDLFLAFRIREGDVGKADFERFFFGKFRPEQQHVAGRERQIKKFPHPPDLFETEYRFRKTGSNLVKIRRKTGNRAEHQHKAGDSHGSVCEAVNQKAIADAVAQKLQREGQQIVREVGTADVKQDFLVSFVDLSVDTINPSAHIDVTKEVLL